MPFCVASAILSPPPLNLDVTFVPHAAGPLQVAERSVTAAYAGFLFPDLARASPP